MKQSRRDFVKAGSASLIYGSALLQSSKSYAKTLHVPLGLQLYSVRELLPKDYDGTLKQIGSIGFREVESAGYYNHSAARGEASHEQRRVAPGERALLLRRFA